MNRRELIKPVAILVLAGIAYWVILNQFIVDRLRQRGVEVRVSTDEVLYSATLSGPQFGDRDLRLVAKVPTLQRIDATSSKITNEGLSVLLQLPHLSLLDVSGTGITNVGLETIARLPKLRMLNVSRTDVSDNGLRSLTSIKTLTGLSIEGCPVSSSGLMQFAGHGELRFLGINGVAMSIEELRALSGALPDVHIDVSPKSFLGVPMQPGGPLQYEWTQPHRMIEVEASSFLTQDDLLQIAHPEHVKTFRDHARHSLDEVGEDVARTNLVLTPGVLRGLRRFVFLEALELNSEVDDAAFRLLCGFPRLKRLVLLDASISDEALATFPEESPIESLSLRSLTLTGSGLAQLARLPQLRTLELVLPNADPETFKELEQLSALQELRLFHVKLTDDQIRFIGHLRQLRTLVLESPEITDGALDVLEGLPELMFCELSRTQIDADRRRAFLEKLRTRRRPASEQSRPPHDEATEPRHVE